MLGKVDGVAPHLLANIDRPSAAYPNPATEELPMPEVVRKKLVALNGQLVWEGHAPSVDVSHFAAGIYTLFSPSGNQRVVIVR